MRLRSIGIAAFVAYVATVLAANWLIFHVGIVDVLGTGLHAPAGVYAVGFALFFRDLVQHALGRRAAVVAIIVGSALSYFVSPSFALASGLSFLASEVADMAVYTPLSSRSWAGAVVLSNTVGAAVDSRLFLTLAFGSTAFFWGQFVGKVAMTIPALAIVYPMRNAVLARYAS